MIALDSYASLFPFIDSHERGQAQFLGNLLYDVLKPRNVIDLGCATGLYLLPFKERGCRVLGLDGDINAGHLLEPLEFMWADLRFPIEIGDAFDLALCIETAEHLQAEYADTLVASVGQSKTVFFSAAHPGQGGQYHYNEQPKSYWEHKFRDLGFYTHPEQGHVLHQIAFNAECQRVQWLIPNAILLVRE